MFNRMRRQDRVLPEAEAERILKDGVHGVLSLNGRNGYPHAVPMNYAFEAGVIWMHAATSGTKLDALREDARASFCVVGPAKVVPDEFTTRYESAIVYGDVAEVSGDDIRHGLTLLADKYAPGLASEARVYMERYLPATTVLRLDIRQLSGKSNR